MIDALSGRPGPSPKLHAADRRQPTRKPHDDGSRRLTASQVKLIRTLATVATLDTSPIEVALYVVKGAMATQPVGDPEMMLEILADHRLIDAGVRMRPPSITLYRITPAGVENLADLARTGAAATIARSVTTTLLYLWTPDLQRAIKTVGEAFGCETL
jgi:hypothetical protein